MPLKVSAMANLATSCILDNILISDINDVIINLATITITIIVSIILIFISEDPIIRMIISPIGAETVWQS